MLVERIQADVSPDELLATRKVSDPKLNLVRRCMLNEKGMVNDTPPPPKHTPALASPFGSAP